jgi:phenylacetate-CoA ligase
MIIFRAVNIYPGQIDHVLSGVKGIGSEYQIILDRGEDGRDYMTIKIERDQEVAPEQDIELNQRIVREVKKQTFVTSTVEIVEYGSLPRSERKSKRVFDNRDT